MVIKPPRNAALRLALVELGGARGLAVLTQVPQRLQTHIEDALDRPGEELRSCVLLGFCREGGHLLSYTTTPVAAAEGREGHCLQLWSFDRGAPCRKVWNVPLFRAGGCLDQQDGEGDDEFELASACSLSLTVAETPGGELLVVHGRPTEVEESDRCLNYLTIIPGPRHAAAQQLQVVHLSYVTAPPHPPFNPFTSLLLFQPQLGVPLPSGAPCAALACNTGDGLRLVTLAVLAAAGAAGAGQPMPQPVPAAGRPPPLSERARQPPEPGRQPRGGLPIGGPPESGGSAGEEPCATEATTAQHAGGGPPAAVGSEHRGQALPSGSRPQRDSSSGAAAAAQAAAAEAAGQEQLQMEMSLREDLVTCCAPPCPSAAAAAAAASAPPSLFTAAAASAATAPPPPGGPTTTAAAARTLPVGQALDWEDFIFGAVRQLGLDLHALEDYGCAVAAQGAWRGAAGLLAVALLRLRGQGPGGPTLALLVHVAAATGVAEVVEVLQPPFPWQADLARALHRPGKAGVAATPPLERLAAFAADWLRARTSAPATRRALPHVLTNRTVLEAGRSLKYLAHPWLPQCILGYRSSRVSSEEEQEG